MAKERFFAVLFDAKGEQVENASPCLIEKEEEKISFLGLSFLKESPSEEDFDLLYKAGVELIFYNGKLYKINHS